MTTTAVDLDALPTGFEVSSFFLERVAVSTTAMFRWTGASNAKTTVCALFRCEPAVVLTGNDPERLRFEIENYEECVIAERVINGNTGTLETQTMVPLPHFDTADAGACIRRPTTKPTILAAGCWQFDDSAVVAASSLVRLTPDDLPKKFTTEVVTTCGDQPVACFDGDLPTLGTCHQGDCRPRCTAPADCWSQLRPTERGSSVTCVGAGDLDPFLGVCLVAKEGGT